MKKIFITFSVCCVVIFSGFFSYKVCRKCRLSSDFSVAVYTVYHKPAPIYKNDVVIPIQAGRALHTDQGRYLEDKMIGDDTGDNISIKNDRYSELTALYWMWKNVHNIKFVGLMHYRRLFRIETSQYNECLDELCHLGLKTERIIEKMQNCDVILPPKQAFNCGKNIYTHYACNHYVEDFYIALNTIRKKYPEMIPTMDQWIHHTRYYPYNMFIMRTELLDEYATWLFDILFAIDADINFNHALYDNSEKKSDISYTYQKRAPGFIAERLFDLWLLYKGDKLKLCAASVYRPSPEDENEIKK